ncbi:MAG: phenylalanine--tRNA ligase subunit beta [Gammaproteobacteria bacterium]|nr:MAG: phenylalanine--tRNA ligase subunit beta [Gammaproteobacteria bacterium]
MLFSEKWLREWVNPDCSSEDLVARLTMAGLEVDGINPVAGEFSAVVVGQVVTCDAHPDADKLSVCRVDVNAGEALTIVCGASNVRAGLKVPVATVGAVLPGGHKIKKAKLRGQESFGMLCSEEELGMAESADGLMELPDSAEVGISIREYLALDDQIVDVDLTPNRGDCLSMAGLAREVGVLYSVDVVPPVIDALPPEHDQTFPVQLSAPEHCAHYAGRVIKGVDVQAATPLWMVEKLRRGGIRSIDPVVDVTNYVMLELGQPMHAFDLENLSGQIDVRLASEGEALVLLDGQEITLKDDSLVIADAEKILALAGVMGGQGSGVSESTQDVFLESAYFNPISIAGRARSYGLHTDSSHRFERGVDYNLQVRAIERASALLKQICGGEIGPLVEVTAADQLPQAKPICLRQARVEQLLGFAMPAEQIQDVMLRLGMKVEQSTPGEWQVIAPSYRFDVEIEEDLIEELGRIYGYSNLPTRMPDMKMQVQKISEDSIAAIRIANCLVDRDYQEAITYSFVDPKMQVLLDPEASPLALANPISTELSVMRTTLWAGLLKALQHNQNRQQDRIRFFEMGHRFITSSEGLTEQNVLAGAVTGPRFEESWTGDKQSVDFYDVKGDLEVVLGLAGGVSCQFEAASHPSLHPGQCCAIVKNGQKIGYLGALHPKVQQALSLDGPIYLFELQLSSVLGGAKAGFEEISKFPEVRRDIAVIVDKGVAAGQLMQGVEEVAGELLRNVTLFDVYEGAGLGNGKKSLAMGLTLQHASRTLNDSEVNSLIDSVVSFLKQEFNATLRD